MLNNEHGDLGSILACVEHLLGLELAGIKSRRTNFLVNLQAEEKEFSGTDTLHIKLGRSAQKDNYYFNDAEAEIRGRQI